MGRMINRIHKLGRPLLQVAMDFTDIYSALRLISRLHDLSIDIYEVGTPLIKSEGIKSLGIIRELVNESLVLADMKTVDTGSLEVKLAASNGADAVSVLASANNEVILSAINEGNVLGVDVVVDTIGRLNPVNSIIDVLPLGARIFNVHVAIDVQIATGKTIADSLKLVDDIKGLSKDIIISVSGGVKPQHISELIKHNVDIIVMGSAITKSPNPAEVVKEVIKLLS